MCRNRPVLPAKRRNSGVDEEDGSEVFCWKHVKEAAQRGDETHKSKNYKHPSDPAMFECLLSSRPDPMCHSYINMVLPINVFLNLAVRFPRSAPKLFGTLCWATGRQHLALQTHNSTICPGPGALRWGHSEATDGQKRHRAAFSLIISVIHPPLSVMMWFKAIVWEWAFTGHNNVIIWFAAPRANAAEAARSSHTSDVELLCLDSQGSCLLWHRSFWPLFLLS